MASDAEGRWNAMLAKKTRARRRLIAVTFVTTAVLGAALPSAALADGPTPPTPVQGGGGSGGGP